ncbi:MAG TPA: hypothetical protein VG410_07765 [Solirubrobacteraceae bacterium]|nr:hypothetical protein [Solirubrobacteraceae bacterium]
MSSRAEILKLARLLGRDPDTFAYLETVSESDTRALRELVVERLYASQGPALTRLAAASKLLPTGLVATIGQRSFGPLLCARVAGLLEPSRAADVAAKLPTPFLADVAVELDPRRAHDVIGHVPPARVAEVAGELAARREYVTLGQFVGHITPDALDAALEQLSDEDLLRTAFVLEDRDGLDELADLLGQERLERLVEVAERDPGLEEAGRELLGHLSAERRAGIAATGR